MKKLLIASTALVASAGFAAADISLSGSANMGVTYDSSRAANQTRLQYEIDFGIAGSGTTDGGLTFGASVDLDAQINNATGNPTAPANGIDDPEIFVSGAFGTLTVGNVDPATDGFGIGDIGFDDTVGIDNDAEANKNAGSAANAHYTVTFNAFTLTASVHTILEDYAVAAVYDFGDIDVGLGYARDAGTGNEATSLDVNGSFGAWGFEAYASQLNAAANVTSYGLFVSYSFGATTIGAGYGDTDIAGDDADFGIEASYNLGGGATLAGGIGSNDGNTLADFGINLSC